MPPGGQTIHTKAYALSCFVLQTCPHGDCHFNVEGLLILQKGDRVALSMVGGCSMVNVLFLELFVSVVQILIDSLVRAQSFRTSRAMYLVTSPHEFLHCPSLPSLVTVPRTLGV